MLLTQSQLQAVGTDAREVLVVAGAGSGKTRVLTERVLFLLRKKGVSASEIMVLTFTRKAANELRERLVAGVTDAEHSDADRPLGGMTVGTFHSVALGILLNDGERIGYDTKTLTVIEPEDRDLLVTQVCRDLGYLSDKGKWRGGLTFKKAVAYREKVYRNGVRPGGSIAAARVFDEYAARLFALNVVDYGHILLQCLKLFRECQGKKEEHGLLDILARYRQRIKHVLVDELQDCDRVQYKFLGMFVPPALFFGVGDSRQSIEERRVCSVGMTRAKERLVVHYRLPEDQSPERPISEPSRFLAEAGLME